MSLHDELARITERAPEVHVPADVFVRARRARRRERLGVLAATAATVALLAGLAAWVPSRTDPPVADSEVLGVPDQLHAVPYRMSDRDGRSGWVRDEVTSDVAVGRAAAAWTTEQGLPVVVGAADGAYHLLDLPGYAGDNSLVQLHTPTVTLSPDGRHLAYSWATFGPDAATEPIPSGIRVVDLETGDLREVPLPGDEGTLVTRIAWSPDSRWLGWAGARMGSWTTASMGASRPVAGRIAPDANRPEEVTLRRADPDGAVAVDDAGRLTLVKPGTVVTWDRERVRAARRQELDDVRGGQAPVRAADGVLAVPTYEQPAVPVVDPATRTVRHWDVGAPGNAWTRTQPLGWVGDDLLAATVAQGAERGALRLLRPEGGGRVVGTVDPWVLDSLSVASDLVTADRPTVERPEPEWPWSEERWVATTVLGCLVLALAGAVGLSRRRTVRGTRQR